jgi:glutamate synthase domain-containing protein 1
MIPEAWQNDVGMSQTKKNYYRWNAYSMEPWDGPGSSSAQILLFISRHYEIEIGIIAYLLVSIAPLVT